MESSQLETTARAIHAALDYSSPPEARLAASTFLESLKTGDVQVLGGIASALVKQSSLSSEVRHYGLKLLQYLVRMRWEELMVGTRAQLADLVLGLVPEIATSQDEWFLKSQTAALVAEVVRHEDTSLWQGLLFKLMELAAVNASYAELVVMVLRWLPEDITVYNEDLEGDRRRQLLYSLTQSLPQIFPLFYKMLEFHFGEALTSLQRNQLEVAKQHAAVVNATLNAVLAYVEWAPVDKIAESGLINACGFLLNAAEFRLRSGEIMKQMMSRKRPSNESAPAFDVTSRKVLEILFQASRALQNAPSANKEEDSEFAECVVEALAAFGSQNLQCFVGFQDHLTAYLQQMLGFYQNSKIGVHYPALLFWLGVLRDVPADPEHSHGNDLIAGKLGVLGPVFGEKKSTTVLISQDVYAILLEHTFKWYSQNSSKGGGLSRNIEEVLDVQDYGNYRGRLLELVRLVAVRRPSIAVVKISERIKAACGSSTSSNLTLGVLESVQKLLEAVIYAVFGGENLIPSIEFSSLQMPLEGILSTLLMAKWSGSAFVEIHGRLLDAMGPFLKTSPAATLSVLNKIFELLTSLPVVSTSFGNDSSLIENSRSGLQVCTSLLRIAKAADKTVSAHLEVIWKTISALQEQGLLKQGEHNLIAEAFLVAGSAAGKECEAKALDCFLTPIQTTWSSNSLQERFLASPETLVALLTKPTGNYANEELWSIFHSVVFTERVVKRWATQHPDCFTQGVFATEPFHPMSNHIKWIITPLLQLLRCIHAFWSSNIKHSLPSVVQAALLLSSAEQASIIGEAGTKKGNATVVNDMEMHTDSQIGGKENEIRNWLKGVRDSSYSLLGLATTHFTDIFFGHDCDAFQICLLENIEAMEYRHVRLLMHFIVIPLVKSCPLRLRDLWLSKLLPGPLTFCDTALSFSWTNLIKNGAVKLSEGACKSEGLGLKEEVLEEKLLRDLSRETCTLLATLASPALNPDLPSGDQLLVSRMEPMKLDSSAVLGSDCMMRFVLQHHNIAKAALSICKQALNWPDTEAVHKALIFCGAIVTVAIVSGNVELQNYVATDLFTAIIEALTMDSNATAQAELINLFRIIYLVMAQQHAAPRQILQSSPTITGEVLLAFENALSTTSSAKEHRNYIKSLLLQAGGSNLKALMAAKSPSLMSNVANRLRSTHDVTAIENADGGKIGLAAFM